MAGQSEAADDLIAELAKLMAQDAQGDRGAKPSGPTIPAAQFVPVRIPGDAGQRSVSGAVPDSVRAPAAANQPGSTSPAVAAEPVVPPRANVAVAPKSVPFQFDFDIRAASVPPSGLEDAPAIADAPAMVPRHFAAAAEPARTVEPASVAPDQEHDSIADLISAELEAHPAPEPEPEQVTAVPTPSPAPVLMSTSVAATAGAQHGVSLGGSRDHDRFRVPPVFGLGSPVAPAASVAVEPSLTARQVTTPVAVAPIPVADSAVALDPIDEIENLIGRAMRVEFDLPEDEARAVTPDPAPASPTPRPVPSPALRSLATPVLPNLAADSLSTADQTIFAAAEATGAKVGWVHDPVAADPGLDSFRAAPRQRRAMGMSRALAGPLVAVTLLLAAGFGLYWVLGLGGREAGPPPLLTADSAPVKEVAPVAAADDGTATQSVVFNEMDGSVPGADEQLVSRDQTDVNEVTQVAADTTDLSDEGLANRKVRTVKVRPDGTIVSGDESVAGSAILPVDRPNVPAVPGAETATPELLADVAPVAPVEPVAAAVPAAPTVIPVEPGSTVPAVDLTGAAIAGKSATIPLMRPNGLRLASAAPVAAEVPLAPVADVAPAAEAAPALGVPGATEVAALGDTAPAYVQLASQRSEADARQSAQNMVTRYGPLFAGANLEVQRVDLGTRGIYYRVRVPAASLEDANLICTNVKAAGGDCFTM